jgi:glyoxylase-like metal-dependent hydrolase (beta-lactamase superfamily II)
VRLRVGAASVTIVREVEPTIALTSLLPDADPSVLEDNKSWLKPHFLDDDGTLRMSIHSFVVESCGQVIVVDTCIGCRPVPGRPDISNLKTAFLERFSTAGFSPGDVDVVACTHLHFDHVGWNTTLVDGRWQPTFPNATYLFARAEYQHWDAGAAGPALTFADAVRPVFEAGLAELVELDHEITAEVRMEPTPGHSPGHVALHLESEGEHAVITGDVVHHPVQFVVPNLTMFADADPPAAIRTRTDFRDRYVNSGARVFGSHFADPSTGFIECDGDAYRFVV